MTGKENLYRLAAYLDALPEGKDGHFDMLAVRLDTNQRNLRGYATAEPLDCGSVACVLGHAPLAFPEIPPLEFESWTDYATRVLGAASWPPGAWWWLFHGSWKLTDNTAKGAAARIRWFLKNGVPNNSADQRQGYASLCYATA